MPPAKTRLQFCRPQKEATGRKLVANSAEQGQRSAGEVIEISRRQERWVQSTDTLAVETRRCPRYQHHLFIKHGFKQASRVCPRFSCRLCAGWRNWDWTDDIGWFVILVCDAVYTPPASSSTTEGTTDGLTCTTRSVPSVPLSDPPPPVVHPTQRESCSKRCGENRDNSRREIDGNTSGRELLQSWHVRATGLGDGDGTVCTGWSLAPAVESGRMLAGVGGSAQIAARQRMGLEVPETKQQELGSANCMPVQRTTYQRPARAMSHPEAFAQQAVRGIRGHQADSEPLSFTSGRC